MRIRSQILATIVATFAAIILLPDSAIACSCGNPRSVDQKIAESENIAVFKVVSIEKGTTDEDSYNVHGLKGATLVVERVFKGSLKVGQQIKFRQGQGGNCGWTFSTNGVGEGYLFYLSSYDESADYWGASICAGNKSIEYAGADIGYLERGALQKGKSRISGVLVQNVLSAVVGGDSATNILANKRVRIKGMGRDIRLKTDKYGVYEVYGLPPGEYTITPERLAGYIPWGFDEKNYSQTVKLENKGHIESDFGYIIDNQVSGRLTDKNGQPIGRVDVKLLPIGGEPFISPYYGRRLTTSTGEFNLRNIPAGTYVLMANSSGRRTAETPFGTIYYPGKSSLTEAGRITVGPGSRLEGLAIVVPEVAEIVTISGTLTYEDGTPVAKKRVEYYEKSNYAARKKDYLAADSDTETDAEGNFSLKVLKGQEGVLFGSMYESYQKDFPCPRMDTLLKLQGEYGTLKTGEIEVETSADITDQKLTFTFPKCKRKHE